MSDLTSKLERTLEGLGLDEAADRAIDSAISDTLNKIRGGMSELDIKTKPHLQEVKAPESSPAYTKIELADTAVDVYRNNINPDRKAVRKKAAQSEPGQPSTIASRANITALSRSLAGMRSSGNDGKYSPVGPNGVGNLGKLSPTGANEVGNVTNNFDNYYALTTDMTLEEYEEYINNLFTEEEEVVEETYEEEEVRHVVGVEEDMVVDLEQRLVTLGSTSWIEVDQLLRETAEEYDVEPRILSREFRNRHGLYPDKWIKENLDVEICGFMPLDEAVRLNKVGDVYEVTFMFRGGTNRLKFFWPSPSKPTKEQMQWEVEKFWPKAKVIAFYPTMETDRECNYMVVSPPITENYQVLDTDDWEDLTEGVEDILRHIYIEEGEPISPPMKTENGSIQVTIADHDTGEVRVVTVEAKNPCWDGYKRKKGTKKFAPGSCVKEGKRGLWDNIHAKRKRGEKPAKPGDKDYPKTLNVEEVDELQEDDMKGMSQKSGDKRSTESGAGLTQKGVEKYRRQNPGSKLKTAVTTPPSKLKPGSKAANRRKSFCARSRGWDGERGKAARRRWNCSENDALLDAMKDIMFEAKLSGEAKEKEMDRLEKQAKGPISKSHTKRFLKARKKKKEDDWLYGERSEKEKKAAGGSKYDKAMGKHVQNRMARGYERNKENIKNKKEGTPFKPDKNKQSGGADDKEYLDKWGHYKHVARRKMGGVSLKYLKKAERLGQEGEVSKDAKLGAAYM